MDRETRIAIEAYRSLYPDAVTYGTVSVLRFDAVPESPLLNRILGLGVDEPATEAELDAALAAIGPAVACYVGVEAEARPPELVNWLQARGCEPGWGWMWFRRGVEPLAPASTSLELVHVGAEEAAAFSRVVATGYGMPEAARAMVERAPAAGWDCWLAVDGDEPVAAAALYCLDGVGYLGFAATLEEHRGKGGQSALLARRIDHARELGCDLVVTETGELRVGLPSSSYRNILRAGFVETAVRANWLRPPQANPVTSH